MNLRITERFKTSCLRMSRERGRRVVARLDRFVEKDESADHPRLDAEQFGLELPPGAECRVLALEESGERLWLFYQREAGPPVTVTFLLMLDDPN